MNDQTEPKGVNGEDTIDPQTKAELTYTKNLEAANQKWVARQTPERLRDTIRRVLSSSEDLRVNLVNTCPAPEDKTAGAVFDANFSIVEQMHDAEPELRQYSAYKVRAMTIDELNKGFQNNPEVDMPVVIRKSRNIAIKYFTSQ
jgi:hypothetical protein